MWMNDALLPGILNMSLTAGIVTLFVLPVRLILKKAPKIYSYLLWSVVLFRLLCPVSFSGNISLLGIMDAPVTERGSIEYIQNEAIDTQNRTVFLSDATIPGTAKREFPDEAGEGNRAEMRKILTEAMTGIWILGMAVMLSVSMAGFIRVRRKLVGRVPYRENIYLSDYITSPFVLGCFRPCIYLPSTLSESEQEYIILHEQIHIKRGDHIVKIIAYAALVLHWFNPLIWLAFVLAEKDMEMSCDEAVLKKMGKDVRADYSASLLSLSTGGRTIIGTPLAFGEGSVKDRIKNVINYKKTATWIAVVSVVMVVVFVICLMANPERKRISYINDGQADWNNVSEILIYSDGFYDRALENPLIISDGEIIHSLVSAALEEKHYELIKKEDYLEGLCSIYVDFGNGAVIGMYEDENYGSISNQMKATGDTYYRLPESLWQETKELLNENKPDKSEENIGSGTDQGAELSADYEKAIWFKPEDIHDLVSASLLVNGNLYIATDKESLDYLEQELSTIDGKIKGGSACPFNSILYIGRSDGIFGKIMPAEDSCAVYLSDGVYYDFGDDNAAFYKIWGLTEDDLRISKASSYVIEDRNVQANVPFLEQWADAFCDRDGKTILSMSSPQLKASFEEQGMTNTGVNDFGWSSPWPWDKETDYLMTVNSNTGAEIWYYAWTSDPHVTVWKENLVFCIEENERVAVETDHLKRFEYICSKEEFYEAYPKGVINGTPMDYLCNGAGEALNNNAKQNKDSEFYACLFEPDAAARYLLNILKNDDKVKITSQIQEDGRAQVTLAFMEKDSYAYVTMIQPYGKDGIWIPQTYEE